MKDLVRSFSRFKPQSRGVQSPSRNSRRPQSAENSLNALRQAVYEAFDAMLDGEKQPSSREKLANAYRAACEAYREAKAAQLTTMAKRQAGG